MGASVWPELPSELTKPRRGEEDRAFIQAGEPPKPFFKKLFWVQLYQIMLSE